MRIATRGSELALWQAHYVSRELVEHGVCDAVELVIVETTGDRDTKTPLHVIGGKGVFVKEVQAAVLDGRADIAVHSAKDLPAVTAPGLVVGAVPERGDARDALVGSTLAELAVGARVATGSARRRAQLAALRPDLSFSELRGNIATRLQKAPQFDAVVMAVVALERLELQPAVVEALSVEQMIPQVGQGSLAVEHREGDSEASEALAHIEDALSRVRFEGERAFLGELGGDCSLPAGAHAVPLANGQLEISGFLASEDLSRSEQMSLVGDDGPAMGTQIARTLRGRIEAG